MCLEFVVPSLHAVDLVVVVFLSGAGGEVSARPLGVAGGDLLDSDGGVVAVVSLHVVLGVSPSSLLGASVRLLVGVVKSAPLVAALEVLRHSGRVGRELGNPVLLGGEEGKPESDFVSRIRFWASLVTKKITTFNYK